METLRMQSAGSAARTGVWVGIGAITMSFGAYTSALVFRQGAAGDWRHFQLPPLLYINTVILLASSVTLGLGQRRIRWAWVQAGSGAPTDAPGILDGVAWLYVTLVMGVLFIAGQVLAWQDLAGQGLFLATNPSSAFFYVLTGLHAVHLLGGLAGVAYVIVRLRRAPAGAANSALGAAGLYWHFMGVLWVYLLLLLNVRL